MPMLCHWFSVFLFGQDMRFLQITVQTESLIWHSIKIRSHARWIRWQKLPDRGIVSITVILISCSDARISFSSKLKFKTERIYIEISFIMKKNLFDFFFKYFIYLIYSKTKIRRIVIEYTKKGWISEKGLARARASRNFDMLKTQPKGAGREIIKAIMCFTICIFKGTTEHPSCGT